MTVQELTSVIGSFGFPIFLIIMIMLFVDKRVWPRLWKYLEDRAVEDQRRYEEKASEERRRHDQYLDNQQKHTEALTAFNITSQGIAQLIATQTDKTDDYHAEQKSMAEKYHAEVINEIRGGKR